MLIMTNKIGLFGGSFDPVHIAHLIIASVIKCEFSLEKIFFIPNYLSPFKINSTETNADHRLEMLKLAVENNDDFELSDFEIRQNRPVYTYETINYFKTLLPNKELYLIVGSDSFKSITNWKNFSHIKKNAGIIIAQRPDNDLSVQEDNEKGIHTSKLCPLMNISSTMIRQMISEKLNIKYLVNEKVQHYIIDERLYPTT